MIYRAYIGNLLTASYLDLMREGLEYIEFAKIAQSDTRVFIKPNLTYPVFRPGVMTTPEAIEAALIAVREYTPHIFLGDADSGGYNTFSMTEVYRETGIAELAGKYGAKIVNLSTLPRKTIQFQYRGKDFSLNLPRLLTDEMDFLITMPVPKIHNMTGVSLTFKNQWGCIPEPADRLRLHPYFKHVIIEVNRAIRTRVAIIDGKFGLNENGPMKGQAVALNWGLVTDNIGAGARLACELMQIPLETINHLEYAQKLGFIPEREQIEVNRDLQLFTKRPFYLKRKWTDLPGLFAFRYPLISYLAYFSSLAHILHRILYLFREPLYDYTKYSKHP
jgi:uncharacterized protein (DUF362 family)